MVIKKKIDKDIEDTRVAFIEKGAQVTADTQSAKNIRRPIVVRVPESLLQEVDDAVKKRYGMNRVAWILEAMQEKLNNGSK